MATDNAGHIQHLEAENKRLKDTIANGEGVLRSANNDVKRLSKYADKLEAENKKLKYEVDTTRGLWCIDRNPAEVDIEWIRRNAVQLESLKGE